MGSRWGLVLKGSCYLGSLAEELAEGLVVRVEVEASDVVENVNRAVVVEAQDQVLIVHLVQPLYHQRGCLGHVQSKEGLVVQDPSFVEVHQFQVGED